MAFASRRALPAVLHNFLGTLSSRNSDHDGYWIFGHLVAELSCATVDLLTDHPATIAAPVWSAFVALARLRFSDQMRTSCDLRFVRRAELTIERERPLDRMVDGAVRGGFEVILSVAVVSDLGTFHRRRATLFVAPHCATLERRRVRRARTPSSIEQ